VATHAHPNPERDVAASIAGHADELGAALVALSAHGRGGLRGLLFGRTSQRVVARASTPVLVAPSPLPETAPVDAVLVPLDPAGAGAPALPLAERLARACRARLLLVTVVPTPGTIPGEAGAAAAFLPHAAASLLDWAEDRARADLELLAGPLRQGGLAIALDVRRGEAARELGRAVEEHTPDLIVMATHGAAGIAGVWAGSVGARIVDSVSRPFILVPLPSSRA
jgi:nucleotide-binding universal stress UspA family protein